MLKILSALALLGAAVAAPGADAPATFKVGEFTFTRPAGWEWVEKRMGVHKAQYKLTKLVNGKSAELWFSDKFPTIDGGPRPMTAFQFADFVTNSFSPPIPTVETNVAGHKLTFVNTRPASEATKPRVSAFQEPGTKRVYAFMESKEGNVMILLSGSKELVDASETEFRKMIESAAAGK